MSIYLESFIMLILCFILYPVTSLDAFSITCILFLIAGYCFMLVIKNRKLLVYMGIPALILTILVPDMAIFLPFICYILFYHKQYWFCSLYTLPVILFLSGSQNYVNFYLLPLFLHMKIVNGQI